MGPITEVLRALDQASSLSQCVLLEDLDPGAADMESRGWVYRNGYLTHVMAPYFDSEEEVEVEVDESAEVYRYRSPQQRSRIVCRPLRDITRYAFRLDALQKDLGQAVGLEPCQVARRKCLIPEHLWYLGDVRLPKPRASAPIFLGRRLSRVPTEALGRAFSDPIFEPGGVVLALRAPPLVFPGRHQLRAIDDFLIGDGQDRRFDRDALARVLRGLPPDVGDEPEEWFDDKTGQLKLKHLPDIVIFKGIQKKIVTVFWKARHGAPLAWADVQIQTGSGSKDLEGAFGGNKPWTDFFVRVEYGKYRMRWSG
jgi:hypothetical protein